MNHEVIGDRLERILPLVQKPGRYVGGELNQVVKDWEHTPLKVALVFPDIYDIGMSNLGLAILYDQINQRPDALAERAFSPWVDMERELRQAGLPLYSLESKRSLADFDVVGFTLPYETLYTNALNVLDLAGIPLTSQERTKAHPLVIAGGHAVYNPEPMHAFIDAFVIGEGEEVIHEILDARAAWQSSGAEREALLESLAGIWGVYVPAFYEASYHPNGALAGMRTLNAAAQLPVVKRIVPRLPPLTTRFIVPNIETVHNRISIEIMRGCTRGCRFCHAGMINRPVRERNVEEILDAIDQAINNTGLEEVGLLSLSSSDYTHILELVRRVGERYQGENISVSLPSLRIETFSADLMDALGVTKRGGFTLAPEAATERMRQIINKPVSTEQLLATAREIYSRGWPTIKLYFMIGHPQETIEDVRAIAELCKAVLKEGRKALGHRAQVNAGVSTFIPKPHTPFQWVPCDSIGQILDKQSLLRRELRGPGLKLSWNPPEGAMLEAWLSRGDRRLSEVIFTAWKNGARFDSWNDQFRYDIWLDAFTSSNLTPEFYTHRSRDLDEVFPWDHISTSVRKKYLAQDYLMSLESQTRQDCRNQCFACGILPTFSEQRQNNPGEIWKCPEVKPRNARKAPALIAPGEISVVG